MSKIEFIALGGLDEKDNKCFILTIDEEIFVINAGILVPPNAQLGVKKITPDFNWLIERKAAVKGIFIGQPEYANFGSLEFLNEYFSNTPIYTTDIGKEIISSFFNSNSFEEEKRELKLNFKTVEGLKTEKVGSIDVIPFKTTTTIPNTVGFVFKNKEDSVIYIDDFIISSNKVLAFTNQIQQLPSLINTPNKILITSIGNVDKISGFTAPSHTISHDIENIIADAKGKIIFATTDSDFYKMFFIMKMVAQKGRPIYFYDKLAEQQMKTMFANKYFSFKAPFKFLKSEELATATNALIIVTAQISNLYPLLTDIINGDDNLIKIEKTDSFVVGSPTINGYEKYHAELFDDANEADIENIVDLGKKVSQIKAGNEDHKFLITTVKPNYIIPVGGLYMDFVNYKNVASLSTNRESVIFADNGQKIRFDNGNLQRSSKEDFIHLEPQFIGSHGVADSGASSMFEREQMKNNGALVVSLMIGKQTKTISKYNFDQVGIVNMDDATIAATNEINKEIVEDLNKLLAASPTGENIDLKEFKNIIKKISQKKYEKKFDKKPLVLSTIIFSKGN